MQLFQNRNQQIPFKMKHPEFLFKRRKLIYAVYLLCARQYAGWGPSVYYHSSQYVHISIRNLTKFKEILSNRERVWIYLSDTKDYSLLFLAISRSLLSKEKLSQKNGTRFDVIFIISLKIDLNVQK